MKRIFFRVTPTGMALEVALTVVGYMVSCAVKKR